MLSVTTAQLNAWLMIFVFPFARVLALLASAPITGTPQFPVTAKIGLAILISLLIAPALPAAAAVDPGSLHGLLLLVREIMVGIAMGLAMRVVFAGIGMAGDLIGAQMGLGFAQFYDPQAGAQVPVLSQFLGLLATLAFLALNGHLLLIAALVESFGTTAPDATRMLGSDPLALARWGGSIFQTAVVLSLPLIAALLITNTALGVLSRASPQLNVFAIGFPITLAVGFIVLLLALPYMVPAFERLFQGGLDAMLRVAVP